MEHKCNQADGETERVTVTFLRRVANGEMNGSLSTQQVRQSFRECLCAAQAIWVLTLQQPLGALLASNMAIKKEPQHAMSQEGEHRGKSVLTRGTEHPRPKEGKGILFEPVSVATGRGYQTQPSQVVAIP
jgi:hypothetical protein